MLLKLFRFCLDAKQEFNQLITEFDLTFSQWQVLKVINLSETQELTVNQIVSELDSDKATISLIVKKLRAKGKLIATTKDSDKRKLYLSLSPEMQAQCSQFKQVEADFITNKFANLTTEEVSQLSDLLEKL